MQLMQVVTLNAGFHSYHRTYPILRREFPGVEPHQTLENKELMINLMESKQQFYSHQHDDIKPLSHDEMVLAEYLQPTTNGRCLNIQYRLEITEEFDGTCCAFHPNCATYMFLQPPYLPSHGQMVAPAGWAPTTYDVVNISIPDQGYSVPTSSLQPQEFYHEEKGDHFEGGEGRHQPSLSNVCIEYAEEEESKQEE